MKHLGTVTICGMCIPVREGSEKDHPVLKGAYGIYDVDSATIWVDVSTPAHVRDSIIVHEALHAVLNSSGAYRSIATMTNLDLENPRDLARMNEIEENLVRILVPHVLETFGPARVTKGRR
jgi:hypothetical protein